MSFAISRKVLMLSCSLAFGAASEAAIVPLSARLSEAPSVAGTGLNGAYYNTNAGLANNAAADSFISSVGIPTATFHSTQPKYTAAAGNSIADSSALNSFLGADGASLSSSGSNTLETSIFRFTGFLRIAPEMDTSAGGPIDVKFRVYSDDGMRLNIGGVTIDEYAAPRAWGYSDGIASFAAAGLYAIDLLYWENHGNTGVNMQWQTGADTAWATVATADLYSSRVPEPASFALIAIGLLGMRRRLLDRAPR